MIDNEDKKSPDFLQTNFNQCRQHQDKLPYAIEEQIDIVVRNIKYYVLLLIAKSPVIGEVEQLKNKLINQLEVLGSEYVSTEKIEKFIQEDHGQKKINKEEEQYEGFRKVEEFGQAVKKLMALKADTENQVQLQNLNKIVACFIKQMQIIIHQDNYTIDRLQKYQTETNNLEGSCLSNDKEVEELPPNHYWQKEKISFRVWQPSSVFEWVQPPLHRQYISEVTHVYSEVVPFKIKFICLDNMEQPKINIPNYFNENIQPQKALIHYCKPGTKNLITYQLSDICKALTINKQLVLERELPVNWVFSQWVKTVMTPDGSIYGLNCRTTETKQDLSLLQITSEKVTSRGRISQARKNSGFVYCNKAIYVIGGNTTNERCSTKNFKYSIKDKKWKQICNANVALRKPTVCSFRDRYIFKVGGINQFDYINKLIQIYDTTTDRWSIVRSNSKNISQEIQILQDSLAVQISQDEIYIFGGKNANNYQVDTGLVFQVMQIREKIKAPAKIYGEFSNVSLKKKNILSFFGVFNQSNVIVHGNCLYTMRASSF